MSDVDMTAGHEMTGLSSLPDPGSVRFAVLGPLEVRKDGVPCAPAPPRQRQMLALLLMRPGCLVHADSIAHEVWPDEPPGDMRTAVQMLAFQLRRYAEEAGLADAGRRLVAVRPSGYVLRVDPGHVDLTVFRSLVRQGQEAFRAGQPERAGTLLRSGLDLWTGTPLDDVECGPVLSSYVVRLQQELRAARHARIQSDIEAGGAGRLIGELRGLVTADPLDEGSHAQLMQVLGILGRRSEALTVYRRLRERLIDELGLEPCETVQEQHAFLLRGGLTAR